MIFTDDQMQRLSICSLFNMKVKNGKQNEEEIKAFVSYVKEQISKDLTDNDSERFIQAHEVETILNIRKNWFSLTGDYEIFEQFFPRVLLPSSNYLVRLKELEVMNAIALYSMNFVPTKLQEYVKNQWESLLEESSLGKGTEKK